MTERWGGKWLKEGWETGERGEERKRETHTEREIGQKQKGKIHTETKRKREEREKKEINRQIEHGFQKRCFKLSSV